MALRPASLAIPFAGGVETRQDPKQVPPARLLDLQNGVFTRATTISKRNGYSAFSKQIEGSALEYTDPKALATRGDELLILTGSRAYSHRPTADRWSDTGGIASVVQTDRALARTGTAQTCPDTATINGVTVVAWEDSRGGVWWAVLEAATGRILRAAAQLDALGSRPRCVPIGAVLHVYYASAAAMRIYALVVNPADPTAAPVPTILVDDLSAANPSYDAEPCFERYAGAVSRPAVIAWVRDAGAGGGYRVGFVDTSGVLGSPVTGLPSVATWAGGTDLPTGPISVAFGPSGDVIAVCFAVAAGARVRMVLSGSPTTNVVTAALTAAGTVARITAAFAIDHTPTDFERLWWAVETSGASADKNTITSGAIDTDAVTTVASTVLRGHGLASRAFADGLNNATERLAPNVYVTIVHPVQFFAYYATIRLNAGIAAASCVTVARSLLGTAAGMPTRPHLPSASEMEHVDGMGSRVTSTPLPYHIQLDSEDGDQFGEIGIRLVTLDFDNVAAFQTAQLGRGLYLAGACPLHYDGARWAEAGFHAAPDVPAGSVIGTVQAAGGALTLLGAYEWKAWYEEIDAQGEIHPGPVSVGVDVTLTGGNNRVTLTIPTLRLTNRQRVRIGVARAIAGDASAFYRVTSTDPTATGSNGYLLNDPTVDSVTFVDDLSDAVLLTREPLYTNGGILSNDPAPFAGAVLAGSGSRLFWTDPSDPNLVRYSQPMQDEVAVQMAAPLSLPVDPYGGAIVGIAPLDDAVIVFKERAIFAFGGPGPLANPLADPQANGYTPSALVTSDVGCVAGAAIGTTPNGLIFPTAKGIYLLGRDRQVSRIGDPVDAYKDQVITAATLLADRPHVVLLTSEGRTLLYDYKHEQWSTFTNHAGLGARLVGGVYHYVRTDGRVFKETPGVYADDHSQIPMVLETAWIKFASYLQGWQKIWHAVFIGEYKSAHTLRVRYRLDYEAGWSAARDLDVNAKYTPAVYGAGPYGAGPYGGGSGSTRYQERIHYNKRCEAIRFQISDLEATGDFGASFELSELLLTGGMVGPAFAVGAARSH